MKNVLIALVLFSGTSASAAQIILNPGEVNNFGVPLTCQIGGGGPVTPPPPPPPSQPRLIGYIRSEPNYSCLQGTPSADPRTIDKYISRCGFRTYPSLQCDSTVVVDTREDGRCFNALYAKETLPGAIHGDQMDRLHSVCTTTNIACYVNQ